MTNNDTQVVRELSYGEKLVRVDFNPSESDMVLQIKVTYAEMIDILDEKRQKSESSEQKRQLSIAITEAQNACMRAVAAYTCNM